MPYLVKRSQVLMWRKERKLNDNQTIFAYCMYYLFLVNHKEVAFPSTESILQKKNKINKKISTQELTTSKEQNTHLYKGSTR